jgi:enamine deaminase RidA (YjgF/YER057c/UK114 family)
MATVTKTEVRTEGAPAPLPFYSQGVVVGNMVYVSGSLAIDPATGEFIEGSVADRTVSLDSLCYGSC